MPLATACRVVLVSTYELGRQPFGLASPASWLTRIGALVECVDLSHHQFREADFTRADFIAFHLPMHTATRLAGPVIQKVAKLNPSAQICAYGLYASVNEEYLRALGVHSIIGGEYEEELTALVQGLMQGAARQRPTSVVSLRRQQFLVPDRSLLPALSQYSQLVLPDGTRRRAGSTEGSRGCKHLCRHCPIVPVYGGRFRIIQRGVVLEDIRQQVASGAQHITFGDPDFFNGIGHALPLVRALHGEFPDVSYDVTIKIEHLLQYPEHLVTLKETGCAFVTSAVESVDDDILRLLDKGHTRADFVRALDLCRQAGLALAPTFVSFMPWITLPAYIDMLRLIASLQLVSAVASIQWAIRLLIPRGSRLLELPETQSVLAGYDDQALSYRWRHPDRRMDALQQEIEAHVRDGGKKSLSREDVFSTIWQAAHAAMGAPPHPVPKSPQLAARCTVPYLTEPWFC
jgi:radical SAM superfamily enzyme YgiQ (UPF0313 family)